MIDSVASSSSSNSEYVESESPVTVKIEMSLVEAMTKVRAKSFVFSLLDELDMCDEKELFSISYAIHRLTKQVHKMIIHFKTVNAGNRFFDKIDAEKESYNLTNLIKNIIDKSEDENDFDEMIHLKDESSTHMASSNVSTDSIYVINDMAYSYIENSSLLVETSYYDIDTVSSVKKENQNSSEIKQENEEINQEESLETIKTDVVSDSLNSDMLLSTHDENYSLELNFNKKLNQNDLDTILIYLENEAANNFLNTESSDIVEYALAEDGYQLGVKFESKLSSDYLLNKKFLKFNDYQFQIAKKFQKPQQILSDNENKELKKTLVLSNISSDLDLNMIKMYAENIASTKLKCINASKIFADTYILVYNEEINYDLVARRMSRRPMLRNRQVELVLPETTNILLVQTQPMSDLDDLVWSSSCVSSIHKRSSFYFLQFESHAAKCDFEAKLNSTKSLLVKEDLFNYEFLTRSSLVKSNSPSGVGRRMSCTTRSEFKINELVIPVFLFAIVLLTYLCPCKSTLKPQVLEESTMNVNTNNNNEPPARNEETCQKENKQAQSFYFEIDLNEKQDFKYLVYWPAKQDELNDELRELNAILSIDERINKVMIWPSDKSSEQVRSGEWHLNLNAYLNELEDTYETRLVTIKNPTSTLDRITYNRLRVHFNKLDDLLWNSSFEIVGYADDVTAVVSKIDEENKKSF